MAVPQRIRSSCSFVSPPTMDVLNLRAQSFIPSTICSRKSIGWPRVMPIAVTSPSGLPPMPAMSLRFTATIDQPMSYGPIPFGMCVFVTIMSVVTSRYFEPMSIAAQSSPIPTAASLLTSLLMSLMVSRSPSVPRVFMTLCTIIRPN